MIHLLDILNLFGIVLCAEFAGYYASANRWGMHVLLTIVAVLLSFLLLS